MLVALVSKGGMFNACVMDCDYVCTLWTSLLSTLLGEMSNGCCIDIHWTSRLDRTVGQTLIVRLDVQ